MYIFVRIVAVILMIIGAMFILAGLGSAVYGLVQAEQFTVLFNQWVQLGVGEIANAAFVPIILGVILIVQGLFVGAFGQLLLLFVELAENTRQTNTLLRSIRKLNE